MSRRHLIATASFVPALLALVAGCSASTTTPATLSNEGQVTRALGAGLEQTVTLTPAELIVGENVQIHSVITNGGTQSISLQSRTCGLDVGGDVELPWPPDIGFCAGHSMGGPIDPGDSRESTDIRRVSSQPGSYTLRVRHALQPERWVEMRVMVRAR